jgi:putative heme-binding domain-containing protein
MGAALAFMVAAAGFGSVARAAPRDGGLFDRENLMAWCIVPFDAKKRGPVERVEMLEELGFKHYAYDWRAEHLPTFESEVAELRKRGIALDAVWFPAGLDDSARTILDVLARNNLQTQLWVTMGDPAPGADQAAKVAAAAKAIGPIADEAAKIGCRVELYNHGNWFGEPENQLAVIEAMGRPNVGIVYNLHHGHTHLDRLPELLRLMGSHLDVLNLNGMDTNGDQFGRKILQLGQGERDLEVLRVITESGYKGPIGIIGHTDDDAAQRLADNLDGLQWLLAKLDGGDPGPAPSPRTPVPARVEPPPVAEGWLVEGRPSYRRPPVTVELSARVDRKDGFDILLACDPKSSGDHWELFTWPGGTLTAFLPNRVPDHVRSEAVIADGKPHTIAMHLEANRVRLYVDGRPVGDVATTFRNVPPDPGPIAIGRLVEGNLGLAGMVRWVRIRAGIREITLGKEGTPKADEDTLGLWDLESARDGARADDLSAGKNPAIRHASRPAPRPVSSNRQAPVPDEPDAAFISALLAQARELGDPARGAKLFVAPTVACVSCHKVGDVGGEIGPDLTATAKDNQAEKLVEALLWPRKEIKEGYATTVVALASGEVFQGYPRGESEGELTLLDPATGRVHRIEKVEIEERRDGGSLMPDGLVASLPADQRLDLVRFLLDLGTASPSPSLPPIPTHGHGPASFAYDRAPLDPAAWPGWELPVNRDRLYDFYSKEADAFRGVRPLPLLLPEYPGLDGGGFGHWGNQNEGTWADDRWSKGDFGNLISGVFRAGDLVVPKGICVRLGEHGELAACFNPETLRYEAIWSGGFVILSGVRHGFLDGLKPAGELREETVGETPAVPFRFLGLYRNGNRVGFAYQIGETEYLDAPWVDEQGAFTRLVMPVAEHPLADLRGGGPPRWPEVIETQGTLGSGPGPFVIDTIALPFDNPWKALMFVGDHDFQPDGTAFLCTMQGDVWRAEGLDSGLEKVRWRRVASGLHQPLGLVVADGLVHVLGRDQITRLRDLNGDGEMDFYECVSNAYKTSAAGHDFICGLERDKNGHFYTASGNDGLIRIDAGGEKVEMLATGFRNPDGLGLGPDGTITVPASEGEWTPTSMICEIRPGGHYGYRGPRDKVAPDLPLVYLPRGLDNSSGGQAFAPGDPRWGPLAGQLIHTSFGAGSWFAILRDHVDGQPQGAVVPMPGEFRSGAHRARFNPADGQLYVSGMGGWGSYTPDDGCFQRVRYVGNGGPVPVGWRAHDNGVMVRFSQAVDASIAEDLASHFVQAWNYRYGPSYGSAEYSPAHPGTRGHDPLTIAGVHLVEDGKALFLELPELQPVNQLHLRLRVGGARPVDLFATVHKLAEAFTEFDGYQATAKTIAAHPILRDLATAAATKPNPWRMTIPGARPIEIEAGKNLTFASAKLEATAGETVRLTFINPDVVPHNWVLSAPGTLQAVGELANKLVADPEAFARHYVPQTGDIVAYTDLVEPGGRSTITFKVPDAPGRYPYLCTFPGHWMVMNGVLVVNPRTSL